MKEIIWFLVLNLLVASAFAANSVIISEVLYDPVGTETGGEAMELFNPTDSSVDISGYVIKTESSAADATIPQGTVLQPRQFYLIADAGWSTLKDDANWSNADYEEAITLTNTDAGVSLVHNNQTIDAVGWGNPANIQAGLFEGNPANHVPAGKSLRRGDLYNDTENNSFDFAESTPDLQNSSMILNNTSSGSDVLLKVSVENTLPQIIDIKLLDESNVSGVQIYPLPGGMKNIKINATVSDSNGMDNISVTANIDDVSYAVLIKIKDLDNTTAIFSGNVSAPFYLAPGNHTITVAVSDSSNESTATADFEFMPTAAIELDASNLNFPSGAPNSFVQLLGDDVFGQKASVKNIGNVQIDLGIYGTNLSNSKSTIPASNLQFSLDNDFESSLSGVMQANMQVVPAELPPADESLMPLAFKLFIPEGITVGDYVGEVTIVAVS